MKPTSSSSSSSSRLGTVALIICYEGETPLLVETLSDDYEIEALENAIKLGDPNPLERVHQLRIKQQVEDEEFGSYVEELLSQRFIKSEIQKHGVQWLKSKIRFEQFKKSEQEATAVIAEYAYRLFYENQEKKDFILAGPKAKVRIRVFTLSMPAKAVA